VSNAGPCNRVPNANWTQIPTATAIASHRVAYQVRLAGLGVSLVMVSVRLPMRLAGGLARRVYVKMPLINAADKSAG
jgi:hypothetical protein